MSIYRVHVITHDAADVLEWVDANIPKEDLVRRIALGGRYDAWMAGAIRSACSPDTPGWGWQVQIYVRRQEAVEIIRDYWQSRAGRVDSWILEYPPKQT